MFSDLRLDQIRRYATESFHSSLAAEGLARATAKRYEFTVVKQGYAWRINRWIAHLDNSLD